MSVTDELIAFVQEQTYASLPDDVIAQTKRCVLDLLGAAIAGSKTSMAQASVRFTQNQFGPGNTTIIGSSVRSNEVGATWANGICASALDLDDGHRLAMGHPGATVIPAALAVAETAGASGKDFLTAVVTGYEVAVRASISMLPEYRAGRYSTGIWGGFGSVTAVGKLLKLNRSTFQYALGTVAAHGPSPPRGDFLHSSMVKEVIGWAGMTGCSSAFLARDGFTGPEDALEQSGRYDIGKLVENLGEGYAILKTYFKPYATCRWAHPAIDGMLKLVREKNLPVEKIEDIHVEGFQSITMLCDYTPATTVAAQYSIPFALAMALSYRRIGPEELTEANLKNPDLLSMAQKVRVSVDPELDSLFPAKTAIRVTIHTGAGDFTTTVEYPKGDPANPMSEAELAEKFRWLAAPVVGEDRSRQLKEMVDHLEQLDNMKQLAALLAV